MTGQFLSALEKEIGLQKDYLSGKKIATIYFGGGTPTVFSAPQIRQIINKLRDTFDVSEEAEITIEANPDDINRIYTRDLKNAGINRFSLGVQSWNDDILKMLNRRHNAQQSEEAIYCILDSGVENISVDLIYGIPGLTYEEWERDLDKTLNYEIKHLSAYHLTFEEGTVFGKMKKEGHLKEIDEEESEKQFNALINKCKKKGFIQYEISNFCKEGFYSVHNTNYWRQEHYLGLGPSAHSFNGDTRQWNISALDKYLISLEKDVLPATMEVLETRDMYNEYIMTSLRTMWGADLDYVEDNINKESRDYLNNLATRFIRYGMVIKEGNRLLLTDQGKMISDNIISELMMV